MQVRVVRADAGDRDQTADRSVELAADGVVVAAFQNVGDVTAEIGDYPRSHRDAADTAVHLLEVVACQPYRCDIVVADGSASLADEFGFAERDLPVHYRNERVESGLDP